jgi:cobalt-zinc-cadmium efflux system outer membrane protein
VRQRKTWCHAAATAAFLGLAMAPSVSQAQAPTVALLSVWRLEDLERVALQNNPTIGQADALIRSVQGRRLQTGYYPNPLIGVSADDIKAREPSRSKYFFWVQQTIITGDKRKVLLNAVRQEQRHAEGEQEIQRQRVLNAVRVAFYETLGLTRMVELRRELARIAGEAVEISEELFNIGQADHPDVLEVEIEAKRAELDVNRAEDDLARAWQALAAMVGDPSLPRRPLVGDLEAELPRVDVEAVRSQLLRDSPELKVARARLERSRAALARARADRIPNFFVRGGLGYNFDQFNGNGNGSGGGNVGVEAFFELGIPLPIFDRNRGNIKSAEAALTIVEKEMRRVELDLTTRLAEAQRNYQDAYRTAETYPREVILRAQRAYELFLERFRQMAASYPQVLIAQRTLSQAKVEYIRSLIDVWQSATILQGQLVMGGLEAPKEIPGEPTIQPELVPFTVTP